MGGKRACRVFGRVLSGFALGVSAGMGRVGGR